MAMEKLNEIDAEDLIRPAGARHAALPQRPPRLPRRPEPVRSSSTDGRCRCHEADRIRMRVFGRGAR